MPSHVVVGDLAFAGVHSDPGREAESRRSGQDPHGAPNRPRGPVEHRQEAVTEVLHVLPRETVEMGSHHLFVGGQQLPPRAVAEVAHSARRLGQFGEQECEEPAMAAGPGGRSDQELLELAEDLFGLADEGKVVTAGELDVAARRACARRSSDRG